VVKPLVNIAVAGLKRIF
jgi:hypothetical protein